MAIFEKLKEKYTLNPNFHYQVGLAQEGLLVKEYVDSYQMAFQLDSQHQKSIYKLIVRWLKEKDFEKTAIMIKAGLDNNPEDLKIIGFNAQLFYAKKQHRKALVWFEKLINRKKAT